MCVRLLLTLTLSHHYPVMVGRGACYEWMEPKLFYLTLLLVTQAIFVEVVVASRMDVSIQY